MKKSHKPLTPRKQRLTIMGPLASKRHEAFCLEYMKDQNGSAAYKRAEYKPKNDDVAKANASRLLTNANVGVLQRIAELEAKYAAKVGFEIEDVLNRAHLADLVSLMHGPCRYHHGTNHACQWRTAHEYAEAIREHLCVPDNSKPYTMKPTDDGGYGYSTKLPPYADRPECDGLGITRVYYADKSTIPGRSRPLFAGIEETQQGIKVKMYDQMAALNAVAKLPWFFYQDNNRTVDASDTLTALLASLQRNSSKMPINSPARDP
jgi:phage terminase small subunit